MVLQGLLLFALTIRAIVTRIRLSRVFQRFMGFPKAHGPKSAHHDGKPASADGTQETSTLAAAAQTYSGIWSLGLGPTCSDTLGS